MKALQILLGIAYPFGIYAGLRLLEPRKLGLLVALAFGLRLLVHDRAWLRAHARALLVPAAGVAAIVGSTLVTNDRRVLLFGPCLVCAALLVSFGRTLLRGPSMVETFALREVDPLSAEERRYCRRVTMLWCGFFVANGAGAFWLGWRGTLEAWTLWNGLLAHLAVGAILAAELVYRRWRFRRYVGAATDPFFRRLFPPREAG